MYEIVDTYLAYWFAVLRDDADLIEGGQGSAVQQRTDGRWRRHVAWVFEHEARAHAQRMVARATPTCVPSPPPICRRDDGPMKAAPAGDPRLEQLLAAPLGCAFLLTARQAGLTLDELLVPETSVDVAAAAQDALDPWRPRAEAARAEALEFDEEDATLAERVVADPRTEWWWHTGPLPAQVRLCGSAPDRTADATADETTRPWEAYAQRPLGYFFTATRVGASSGMHAEVANYVGDWSPEYPLTEHDIQVADHARVFHIISAADWHRLATTFPAPMRGSNAAGVVNEVSPDWRAVGEQWDAVHLTFGGLLSALFVPVTSGAGTTTLWTWESERTLWLHRPFTTQRAGRVITDELLGERMLLLESHRPSGTPDRARLVARKAPFWRRWFQRR